MPKQIKKQAPPKEEEQVQEPEIPEQTEAEKLIAETDALLDEIDGMLEEQAEDFVRNYVQKGGE